VTGDDLDRRAEALRRAAIFGRLGEPSLRRVAALMTEVELPPGHVLIEPGQPGSGLFVIEEGSVSVQTRAGATSELGPGDVVGELALLSPDGVRSARVRATTSLRCLTLDRASFERAVAEEPGLAISLLAVAVERLD
jgi:CRP-like cAMP-binding protein